jgi:hypothetical protein
VVQSTDWLDQNYLIGEFTMTEIVMVEKATRVRCSDEQFLEAVFSSNTYAEISEKTGQKIATTIARYSRAKANLAKEGIELPAMQRKTTVRSNKNGSLADIARRLKSHVDG